MKLSNCISLLLLLQSGRTLMASRKVTKSFQKLNDPNAQLGVMIEDLAVLSAHENSKQEKVIEAKIYWRFLGTTISEGIKQDCGAKLLIPYLIKPFTNDTFKPEGVTCSFTREYALISTVVPNKLELMYYNGKIITLTTKSIKGDQEVCTVMLRGYEKFRTIIVAYVFGKEKLTKNEQFVIINLPQGFDRLIKISNGKVSQNEYEFVPFNPYEGKGKRFKHTKKCIETLIKNISVDDIQDNCIIECKDFDEDLSVLPIIHQKRTEL